LADLLILSFIALVGWFLIGFYTKGNFLETGYQDLIYHAGKALSLKMYGLTSWDHVWANGINYWRLYQYIPHLAILLVSTIANLSINKALVWMIVAVFILTRLLLYLVFRIYKIRPIIALTGILVSFAIPFEWNSMKDYSIFFANLWIPIFLIPWIALVQKTSQKRFLITAAFAGFAFTIHPVAGVILSGLFLFTLFFRREMLSLKNIIANLVVLILGSAPFTISYIWHLLKEYSFANPFLSSQNFAKNVLGQLHVSIGALLLILFFFAWVVSIFKWRRRSKSGFTLLVFCSLVLFSFTLALDGVTPQILNQTQFVRGLGFVCLLLVSSYVLIAEKLIPEKISKLYITFSAILCAGAIIYAIAVIGYRTAVPVLAIQNPVYEYFKNKTVEGSVYYNNVSETSFLMPTLRQPTSYFEHLLASPISLRYSSLLQDENVFTQLSDRQIQIINAYSNVLGVEYLVFPKYSRITEDLLSSGGSKEGFESFADVKSGGADFTIVKNQNPINYAYIVDQDNAAILTGRPPSDPTVSTDSYRDWDNLVIKYSNNINDGTFKPVIFNFVYPNILTVDIPENVKPGSYLLIAQNYDTNWHASSDLQVKNNSLRMISIKVPDNFSGRITLTNSWPNWFLPLQFVGISTIILILIVSGVVYLFERRKK